MLVTAFRIAAILLWVEGRVCGAFDSKFVRDLFRDFRGMFGYARAKPEQIPNKVNRKTGARPDRNGGVMHRNGSEMVG